MFQTAAGVTVPFPEKLSEQYELDGNTITANLSFEKLSDFVHSFYAEKIRHGADRTSCHRMGYVLRRKARRRRAPRDRRSDRAGYD